VRLFLGGATLDDAVAQLILQVTRVLDVAPKPEGDSLGLTRRERLGLRVEERPQRCVDGG